MCNYDQKKLKTRSTKIKKPLLNYETVADKKVELTGSWFPPVFTETMPKVARKKEKSGKFQKFTDIFQNKYMRSHNRH